MKFIWILFLLFIFIFVVIFSILNSNLVTLDFIWWKVQTPLAIPLIIMFIFGSLIGLLVSYIKKR